MPQAIAIIFIPSIRIPKTLYRSKQPFPFRLCTKLMKFLTFSTPTVAIQLIFIVACGDGAPRTPGSHSDAVVVSSASVNKREHATVAASGASSTGSCKQRNNTQVRQTEQTFKF